MIPVESMIRFQCSSKAALSCGSSLTNAAILLASGSSCCSKKMEMSEVSTFRRVIVTESFIYIFYLTRIRRQFVVHFCRHRGKFAGKDGGSSTRILRQNPHAKKFRKNYMSDKITEFWHSNRHPANVKVAMRLAPLESRIRSGFPT